MLRRVLKSWGRFEIQDPTPDGSLATIKEFRLHTFINATFWDKFSRMPKELQALWIPKAAGWLADQFWSRWVPPCTIFHNLRGSHLISLQAAKQRGAITVIENAGRHPRHWLETDTEEPRRFGVSPDECRLPWTAWALPQIEREYAFCDCIVVPSSIAHKSLAEFGLEGKTAIVAPGVDADLFSPLPRFDRHLFRACFVGRVELTKGVGYLLEVWKRLALPNAELLVVGAVKPEMNTLLRTHADSTVQMTGPLPAHEVTQRYRESDLFVFPSVNEGLAQVLLEAMASGLPAVATDMSGATDCIENGKEGFIVPARDVDALADAISWCYHHRDALPAMGRAARLKIENQFTLEHYNQRQIALYRSLAGRPATPPALP